MDQDQGGVGGTGWSPFWGSSRALLSTAPPCLPLLPGSASTGQGLTLQLTPNSEIVLQTICLCSSTLQIP